MAISDEREIGKTNKRMKGVVNRGGAWHRRKLGLEKRASCEHKGSGNRKREGERKRESKHISILYVHVHVSVYYQQNYLLCEVYQQ